MTTSFEGKIYPPSVSTMQTDQVQAPVVTIVVDVPEKSICKAYLFCFPFGFVGLHQFYLGRYGWGMVYFFTLGLFGVGFVCDLVRLPCLVKSINEENRAKAFGHPLLKQKRLDDAYIACIPLGLLGFHNFYLERPGWGCLYLFTFGLLGIGWLVDVFRLPSLVNRVNQKLLAQNLERIQPTTQSPSGRSRVTINVYGNIQPHVQPPPPQRPAAPVCPPPAAYPPVEQRHLPSSVPRPSYPSAAAAAYAPTQLAAGETYPPSYNEACSSDSPPPEYSGPSYQQNTPGMMKEKDFLPY
ncbi:TM2 domain-containing protein DDB_G0277895-like [Ptychodera flava]|uniref:TM2 domain-containing protein DDB_G0277895-like n=1 Tax=Ptychodera flava TaxID=63121 RepID=UPI00396AAAA8